MTNKTIYLGTDHGGFQLKNELMTWLISQGKSIEDCGAFSLDLTDDYPDFASAVAKKIASNSGSMGILFCRSGAGMSIAANKFKGIRAAEGYSVQAATHAREHNDANVISLSADWLNEDETKKIIEAFLTTEFSGDERHVRRVEKLEKLTMLSFS